MEKRELFNQAAKVQCDNLLLLLRHYKPQIGVAIHLLVIVGLSAITLNNFFEPAHLYRRSVFDFARIKREDLFEVVVFTQQRVPQRPKQNKNTRMKDVKQTTTACRL
jgi:hypothetical protein